MPVGHWSVSPGPQVAPSSVPVLTSRVIVLNFLTGFSM